MLSIIVPSHNRADLLRACLTTVLRHAPAMTEVMVVDDGSPSEVATRTAAAFAGVRPVRQSCRRGFCAAANLGLREARAPIVELLNDDTEVTAGWATAALRAFADPAVAAVAPLVLQWQGNSAASPRIDSAGDRYYLGGVAGKRGHGQPLQTAFLQGGPVFGASASSAFFRRDAVLKVGAFPETFGAYFEDVDLAFRLGAAGYQVLFEPASRVYHHVSSSHGRTGRRLLEQQSRNEERVFWRNIPDQLLLAALPRHVAVLAAKAWRRWDRGGFWPFLTGRLRAWAEVKAFAQHRRCWPLTQQAKPLSWHIEHRLWETARRSP